MPATKAALKTALPLLEELPDPMVWIGRDYQVHWANRAARAAYDDRQGRCHELSHRYTRPCNEHGEQCPMIRALERGEASSAFHAHPLSSDQAGLFKVVAIPVEGAGALEMHLALGRDLCLDPLTGLYRREFWLEIARSGRALLARLRNSYSLLFLDLDEFKSFNDRFGHSKGDEVLSRVGEVVRGRIRASDTAGRYGGEEIVVFMPHTQHHEAMALAERLRLGIRAIPIQTPESVEHITASIGLHTAHPDQPIEETLELSDRAMYRAKGTGRDRVVGTSTPPPPSVIGPWSGKRKHH